MSNQVPCAVPDGEGGLLRAAHVYDKDGYCSICGHYRPARTPIYTQAELDAELERVRRETQLETFRIFTDTAAEFLGRTKVDKIIGGALKAARDAALSAGKENNRESISEAVDTQRR